MRCSNCSFPLSPSRKSCPRCGAVVAGKSDKRHSQPGVISPPPQGTFSALLGGSVNREVTPEKGQLPPAQFAQGQPSFPQSVTPSIQQQTSKEVVEQLPFPETSFTKPPQVSGTTLPEQQHQLRHAAPPITPFPPNSPPHTPTPNGDWLLPSPPPTPAAPPTEHKAFSRLSQQITSDPRRTTRLGFTIAVACTLVGCLLLVFVYVTSLTLPPASSQQALHTPTTDSTPTVAHNSPTPAGTSAPETTPAPTATASTDFPGQQYIDNARMASAVNTTTATPIQETSNFKVNQRIYVTFSVHTKVRGTICLIWYLNNQRFTNWNYPVAAISIPIYSYAISSTPGDGYVEIYWATQPSCVDKILAQRVNFTVSA